MTMDYLLWVCSLIVPAVLAVEGTCLHVYIILIAIKTPTEDESCRRPVRIHVSCIYFICNSDHVTGALYAAAAAAADPPHL